MGNQCSCNANTKARASEEINNNKDSIKEEIDQSIESVINECDSAVEDSQKKIRNTKVKQCQRSSQLQIKKSKRNRLMIPEADADASGTDHVDFLDRNILATDRAIIMKTFKNHFILSQMSEDECTYIVSKMKYCLISKDNFIFKQGDPSFFYYIILSGKCKVLINGIQKREIGIGDSFGDLGIIYNAPRSATVKAFQNCQLAGLNRKDFHESIQKINRNLQQTNKSILQKIQFYQSLTENQKNVLASSCISEIYSPGHLIFGKGDDANAFYIVCSGTVVLLQKNIELKEGDNVGLNAILNQQKLPRTCSLQAKTECKLLSINKNTISEQLGGDIVVIIQKNIAFKLVNQNNQIKEIFSPKKWESIIARIQFRRVSSGQIVFRKGQKISSNFLLVLLSTELRTKNNFFIAANSILEAKCLKQGKQIYISDDLLAVNDGFIGQIDLSKEIQEYHNQKDISSMPNQKSFLSLQDFIVIRKLRSGNFGHVYACYNTKTAQKYAIKVMDKSYLNKSKLISYAIREQQNLKEIPAHPFIVKFYHVETDRFFIKLILELIEGQDFFDSMYTRLPLSENERKFYIAQIVLMLQHLHTNKFIYRDLKPQNLMVGLDGYLKLVDMGTAKRLTIQSRYKTNTIIGTPHYIAPQIIKGKGYSYPSDVWSLGVFLYEISCGKLPFGETQDDPFRIYEQIISKQIISFPNCKEKVCQSFIQILLKKSSHQRPTWRSIIANSYFEDIDWEKLFQKKLRAYYAPSASMKINNIEISACLSKNQKASAIFMKNRKKNMSSSTKMDELTLQNSF